MSKHTPGPWLMARNDCHSGGMATIHHCINNDWIEIWTDKWCCEGEDLTEERMEANAMLMLAAPDLLEALEGLLHAYEDPGNAGSTHDDKVAAARSSIAKARGEA
jgi:hypothetical protein